MLVTESTRLFVFSLLLVLPVSAGFDGERGFLPPSKVPVLPASNDDITQIQSSEGYFSEENGVREDGSKPVFDWSGSDKEGNVRVCEELRADARLKVDVRQLSFDFQCAGAGGYVSGPASPFQFPVRAEAEAFFEWKTVAARNRLRNGAEFLLTQCESQLAFFHAPKLNARKVKELSLKQGKPLLAVVLSLDGIDKTQFLTEMHHTRNAFRAISERHSAALFRNHRISSSLFTKQTVAKAAFDRIPEKNLFAGLQSRGFLTMANIEGCESFFNASLPADHTAYEFYCALERLADDECSKETIAHEAGFDYIRKFLQQSFTANSFVYSYLTVKDISSFDQYLSAFVEELFATYEDENDIAVIGEVSQSGRNSVAWLLATSSVMQRHELGRWNLAHNTEATTNSQDIESTVLRLAEYPQDMSAVTYDLITTALPQTRTDQNLRVLPWLSSEFEEVDIHGDVLDSMVAQIETYAAKLTKHSPCGLLTVDVPSISARQNPANSDYMLQFRVQSDQRASFTALFTSLQLSSLDRSDRLGLLCASLPRSSAVPPSLCLC